MVLPDDVRVFETNVYIHFCPHLLIIPFVANSLVFQLHDFDCNCLLADTHIHTYTHTHTHTHTRMSIDGCGR